MGLREKSIFEHPALRESTHKRTMSLRKQKVAKKDREQRTKRLLTKTNSVKYNIFQNESGYKAIKKGIVAERLKMFNKLKQRQTETQSFSDWRKQRAAAARRV